MSLENDKFFHDCECDECNRPDREPSPERRSNFDYRDCPIVSMEEHRPFHDQLPSNVLINLQQIRSQKMYKDLAQEMSNVMEEMSTQKKHGRREDVRDRLRRKMAEKYARK